MKTVRIGKHIESCYALDAVERGEWNTVWYFPKHPWEWLDKNGQGRGKSTCWIRLECNYTYCEAQLLVLEDDLMEAIGNAT